MSDDVKGTGTIWSKPQSRRKTVRLDKWLLAAALSFFFAAAGEGSPTTAFTFQGRLSDTGTPANGNYDMQLKLFDTATVGGGTQIGATITRSAVKATDGVFTVQLDFTAAAFPGADRFLEVGLKPAGSNTAFTILKPRQPITPTPYAIYSASSATATHASTATLATNATNATNATTATNANTAANSTKLNNIAANQYVLTGDPRLTNARPPTPGSTHYIQNTTTQEAGNFNISGNGIIGGNVGIGTATPTSKLDVVGQDAVRLIGYQPFLTLYDSNAGYAGGRIQAAGGDLNLFTQSYLDGSNGSSFLKLANSGNVGIGTFTPNTKLTISGGSAWTANGWAGSMNLQNGAALGWEANASGQRAGIGHSDGGLYFFRTNSAFGNTGSPANYDMQITDAGDVTQPRDKAGFVKAMAFINPFNQPAQYVVRAYNSAGNPITMTRDGVGQYKVDFGFDVRDRFISATSANSSIAISAFPYFGSPNAVGVDTNETYDGNGNSADAEFFLFVY